MGFGIKRKLNYTFACAEDLLFRLNLKGSRKDLGLLQISHYGRCPVKIDELGDFLQGWKDRIIPEAELVMQHRFDILGTGLQHWGNPIRWHLDIRSEREWPIQYYKKLVCKDLTGSNGKDVKIPWELSRFQHLMPLIQAFLITGDSKYPREAIPQITQWIEANPFLYGVNWTCAMEVAIRACNWIWVWWTFREDPAWTDNFNRCFLKSLWEHGWYIEHNLENKGGIRTNHYLSDIVGLLFIGIMFPQFKDAERWKGFGVTELVRCTEDMVYPDGVSFENSTAYHRLVMELFTYSAILCDKNGIELPQAFWGRLEKMNEFTMYCTRPDGRMPMIGDSDDGRFFIFSAYYDWDRWDHRYLLSIGAVLFSRADFKAAAGWFCEEAFWILGEQGYKRFEEL